MDELNEEVMHLGVAPYMFGPEASSSSKSENENNAMPQQEQNRMQDADRTW